ncbi:DUF4192 domain-containing protein [Paenarthrobacter sp. PH39-S1]|uniref:DUF4192 domain-containing protein n=1 Tax=Paenarthrobacter sp. PH39-S1 TaxID=3046204 RepID=UPI0024B93411|nr:DUF4192 domain-containing protein [Paenarthrobacter sp. PH39-S1]MDJ0357430.1 DUF4192 domain-containing protein [Paenarthrobacter sp. PH39-S1]
MTTEQRLSISSGEDILSYIPHSLGYWPARSLVCLTMAGKTIGATLRVDLPDVHDVGLPDFAHYVCAALGADEHADGVLLAVFGRRDWLVPGRIPYRRLMEVLESALRKAGTPVKEKWFLGPAYWRNYVCTDIDCCGWPGRPLDDIVSSALNAELIFRGSGYLDPQERAGSAVVPLPDGAGLAVHRALQTSTAVLSGRQLGQEQFMATLQAWELAIARWPEPPAATTSGYLLASLESVTVRDAVLVLASVGAQLAFAGALGYGLLAENEQDIVRPVPWEPTTREGVALRSSFSAGDDLLWQDFGRVLMGEGASDPDWNRLDKMDELLTHLSRAASGEPRAAVLTMLAWAQWCRGRGSAADAYLRLALRDAAGYRLALLLGELVSRGIICNWARDRRTSWHPPTDR